MANVYKPFSASEMTPTLRQSPNCRTRASKDGPGRREVMVPRPATSQRWQPNLSGGGGGESIDILNCRNELGAAAQRVSPNRWMPQTLLVVQGRRGLRASDVSGWKDSLGDRLARSLRKRHHALHERGECGEHRSVFR